MRGKDLLRDIEYIDDSLIEEAKDGNITKIANISSKSNTPRASKKKIWISLGSAAAILCISVGTLRLTETKNNYESIPAENAAFEDVKAAKDYDNMQQPAEEAAEEVIQETNKLGNVTVTNEESNDISDMAIPMETEKSQSQMKETDALKVDKTIAAEEALEDKPALIRVNGVLYYDSGKISTEARCGMMDGTITMQSDGIPHEDNQANFGTGYGYQFWPGRIEVLIDGEWHMFYPYEDETVYEINEYSTPEYKAE